MVKRKGLGLMSLFLAIMFTSFASAEILIENEPKEIYSLGDTLTSSATIEVSEDTSGKLKVELVCGGDEIELRSQNSYFISMQAHGGERTVSTTSLISNELMSGYTGECLTKVSFADQEPATTEEFEISDEITMDIGENDTSFKPNSTATFSGRAIKANGKPSEGFIEVKISGQGESNLVEKKKTISNGQFSIEVDFPEGVPAGNYDAKFSAYEKPNEEKTNTGSINKEIKIEQVPSNLEIIMNKEEVSAGESVEINTILHDQTGESIDTKSRIVLRDSKKQVFERSEQDTGQSQVFEIPSNETISEWTVTAQSNGLTNERKLQITENKEINAEILGSKVNVTNIGNVPFNDSVEVEIGNETTKVNVSLPVGTSESYRLTAPDGEYEVSVYDGEEQKASAKTTLTGSSVGAKKGGAGAGAWSILAWVFVALVLGFVSYVFFQRTRNKTFFTREPTATNKPSQKQHQSQQVTQQVQEKSKHGINSRNKAEVSLSISGDKQRTTAVCIHLKNLHQMEESKSYAEQTLQKIVDYAEKHNAYTYEDNENLYFLLAPSKTKTFRNEGAALNIAVTAKRTIEKHNKLFKKNIEYGISINSGEAIFKEEGQETKFMSVSKLVPFSKKLAAQSKNANAKVLASKEITDKMKSRIKTEKFNEQENVYKITGIKKYNSEDTQKFISKFQERMEKEKAEHEKNTNGRPKHKGPEKNQERSHKNNKNQ